MISEDDHSLQQDYLNTTVSQFRIDIISLIIVSVVVVFGLLLCILVFFIIIWYQDLYQPRYIHQANVLLASFFSIFTFGLVFMGLPIINNSDLKCK